MRIVEPAGTLSGAEAVAVTVAVPLVQTKPGAERLDSASVGGSWRIQTPLPRVMPKSRPLSTETQRLTPVG